MPRSLISLLSVPCLYMALCAFSVSEGTAAETLFDDAVAFWPMAGPEDVAGENSQLEAHGEVEFGLSLEDADQMASATYGGDGVAAQLAGGWLSAEHGAGEELNVTGEEFTFLIRLEVPAEGWEGTIASKQIDDQFLFRLFVTPKGARQYLVCQVGVDGLDPPLQVRVPVEWLGPASWKEIIVRCDEAKIWLFVDGVWQDEDFVLGKPRANEKAPLLIGAPAADDGANPGFAGRIDHVAFWNRALSDEEIVAQSGGPEFVEHRRVQMSEPSDTPLQYWNPRHEDWNVGDCLPFYHDGVFHFLYLADKRHHGSKGGLGAHQWAHATSTDLVHWQHHEMAVPVSEQWEGSICTGSMFYHDGLYYAFYATRMSDRSGEYVSLATSEDGIHFEKQEPNPLAGPEPPYRVGPFRDPHVFQDPDTGLFHMLVTAALAEPELAHRGDCLAHLVSEDLISWEEGEPFFEPGYITAPECMEHFYWNGWWYLVSSNQGTARYRMSRSPLGPWTKPRVDTFGGPLEYVMKSAEYHDNRRIGCAWIGQGGWAGHAVFREIVQFEDGTLGTKFPPEMALPAGEPADMPFVALSGDVTASENSVRVNSEYGFSVGALEGMPHNCRITMTIESSSPAAEFGICMRGEGNYAAGNELRFAPAEQKVGLRDALSAPRHDDDNRTLYAVDGLDEPFTLEVVLKDDLIDICVDERRTMLYRTGELGGERLFFFALHGDVTFSDIQVLPLLEAEN